jgi:hypothetical protein
MNVIYTIDTTTYEPISFGSMYLYNQYDKIQSFLLKNYQNKYKDILAKPILSGGQVIWYGHFNDPMSRLSDLTEEVQTTIKTAYWSTKLDITKDIDLLIASRDTEKKNWGQLLKEVFNDDNNVILSNGSAWCLLWGWKFKTKQENYLSPEFMPRLMAEPPIPAPYTADTGVVDQEAIDQEPFIEPEPIPVDTASPPPENRRVSVSIWTRIKHFLRWFAYRFWGFLLLILLILFIACMIKTCAKNQQLENCNRLDSLNRSLQDVQKKAEQRCDTIR